MASSKCVKYAVPAFTFVGAVLGATVVATACQHTPTVRTSVSVFCSEFEPILDGQRARIRSLPTDLAEAIVGHNAVYKELCEKKGIYQKIRSFFRGKED